MGLVANGWVPPTVTWEALSAWRREGGIPPIQRWEARALVQLGAVRASIQAEKQEAERKAADRQRARKKG